MTVFDVLRLIGCQDLLEEVPPTLDKPENLFMAVACPPDYKSLPRMSKSVRGTVKNAGFRDEPSSKLVTNFILSLYVPIEIADNLLLCMNNCGVKLAS